LWKCSGSAASPSPSGSPRTKHRTRGWASAIWRCARLRPDPGARRTCARAFVCPQIVRNCAPDCGGGTRACNTSRKLGPSCGIVCMSQFLSPATALIAAPGFLHAGMPKHGVHPSLLRVAIARPMMGQARVRPATPRPPAKAR
jgi:hypothetical protein